MEHNLIVTRDEWLVARKALLAKEKEATRARDALSAERRTLPWVKVEKNYVFDTPNGRKTLADLFGGRSQLIIYHFMFRPGWEEGCRSCSFLTDHIDGSVVHLAHRDVTLMVVSRAPLPQIEAFRKRMSWRFKWASSYGNDFNSDYHVSFTKDDMAKGQTYYNYEVRESADESEAPGTSVFYKNTTGAIFHTYSSYARGLDMLVGAYNYLDLVPKGRDEDALTFTMAWVRHHDRYGDDYVVDPKAPYLPPKESDSCHRSGENHS
ncbi:MAG: thioredoxin family protein [Deltaproteobacteria bacterium]|nr:thioredoxin family protein [Deltaproteobacteria bacterium]